MFEPLTVRVGDAVGMLRFCLEPISVNSVVVTFRESLNASSASMVPLFQGNKLAFLAYRYIHPSPTLKTKQNRGEKEGSRRLFVVFFSPLRGGYGCTHAIHFKLKLKKKRIYFFFSGWERYLGKSSTFILESAFFFEYSSRTQPNIWYLRIVETLLCNYWRFNFIFC